MTLKVFDEDLTKFWEDEIKKMKQTRKSSSLIPSVLIEKWSNNSIVTSWLFLPVKVDFFLSCLWYGFAVWASYNFMTIFYDSVLTSKI